MEFKYKALQISHLRELDNCFGEPFSGKDENRNVWAIEWSQEYRTALMTAAVSWKIDVREALA